MFAEAAPSWRSRAEQPSPWSFPRPRSAQQELQGEPKSNGTWQGCREPMILLRCPSASHSAR